MAKLGISTGTTPNDGTGDTLLSGATKINNNFNEIYNRFGDGTNLTAIGGTWASSSVGIHTLKNVGIGTTNPTSTLTVRGDVSVSGVITAASFSGNVPNASNANYASVSGLSTYATRSGIATYATVAGVSTVSQGLTGTPNVVLGVVTATSFIGDGSGLTGIIGSGSGGIVIKDDGSTVGTAGTIDFGNNLTVSAISAGVVTVTGAAGGAPSQWTTTSSGIHTLSNVGIGTTVTTARFQVGSATTNTNQFTITDSGDVGIGTTNPGHFDGFSVLTLDGKDYQFLGNTLSGGGNIIFKSKGDKTLDIYSYNDPVGIGTATNIDLYYNLYIQQASGTNLVTLTKFGNVGIGSTNPTSALTVKGNTSLGTLNVSGVSTFSGRINVGGNGILFDSNSYTGSDEPIKLWIGASGSNRYFTLRRSNGGQVVFDNAYPTTGHNDHRAQTHSFTQSGSEYYALFNNGSVKLYHPASANGILDQKLETIGVGVTVTGTTLTNQISVSGVSTLSSNVSVGGTINLSGGLKLGTNNPTIVGTSGTVGEIKRIGGAPFFYDGSAWREFVLSSGTPVSVPADTEWDNVVFRATFDTNFTDAKFGATPVYVSAGSSIVGAAVTIGTGAYRNNGGSVIGVGVSYPYRSDYDFTGSWTIEFWMYHDSYPTQYDAIISQISLSNNTGNWTLSTLAGASSVFFVWDNENNNGGQRILASISNSSYNNTYIDRWHHYALVREGSSGSLHFYIDGIETPYTINNTIIDNDILHINGAGLVFASGAGNSQPQINGFIYNNGYSLDAILDDVRISCGVGTAGQRYTSIGITTYATFNPPTTALPTTGTLSSYVQPPGDKYGEITLGGSPTWRGTSGVTVSQQSSGNYRVSFATTHTNANDYFVLTQAMDQGFASYVGVARSTTHVDFSISRESDNSAVNTGSLAVQIKNHI